MNEDKDFVRAIVADPDNDTLRLVYADWLEERGDARAEFLRLAVRLQDLDEQDSELQALRLRQNDLRAAINPRWLNLVQRPANADEEFYFPNRHLRLRPGMYIPGLNVTGLHYLANELISYSMEEIQAGHGTTIEVRIPGDGSLTVRDDGRAISLEVDPDSQGIALEMIMTGRAFVGGHHGQQRLTGSSRGLHYMGAATAIGLSDWASATVCSAGRLYRQEYERGLPISDIEDIGPSTTPWGTTITFHPDPEVFEVAFAGDHLAAHVRELAFLNNDVTMRFADERNGVEEQFHYPGAVADFVAHLCGTDERLHKVIHASRTSNGVRVDVAMLFTPSSDEQVRCYANSAFNSNGGTHRTGFRTGLTRALNAYVRGQQPRWKLRGEDCRAGLRAVVSVHLNDPWFISQSKQYLTNPEVEGVVARAMREVLTAFLRENPEDAQRIIGDLQATAQMR